MQKPVILTVDDDPEVLRAIERDLKAHYENRYRVLRADSGRAALDLLRRLQQRNDAVALMVVDHRMPQMNGVEMLQEAIKLYPTPSERCSPLTRIPKPPSKPSTTFNSITIC